MFTLPQKPPLPTEVHFLALTICGCNNRNDRYFFDDSLMPSSIYCFTRIFATVQWLCC